MTMTLPRFSDCYHGPTYPLWQILHEMVLV